ncbi:DUF2147 domain-containing protein [Caulobacter sp. D4A]|uniref:DUF2147 domain-containing protein n=1 Tax=unclassified Caulobacter TaxID=2648921 RepID=UPI000D737E8A|nr:MULTISPECIES: DUF2147 domain-containing protein [unclassified Caulobacter]PXA80528.1 DUF2147 domain-containing protein [Caulobacter sp. D4A]PXA91686.1 DUF2147 domain-containing protein [Caulobacter sp. D5]
MLRTAILAAVASAAFVAPAMAADITGLWLTETNGGQVEVSRCGNSLCGKLVTSDHIKTDPSKKDVKNKDASLRTRPLKGMQMLWGFSGGPEKWTGGKVYNADDGGTYSGTITMTSPDKLKLKGCIVAPLCKTQTWTRLK